jgi:hypothetical protein
MRVSARRWRSATGCVRGARGCWISPFEIDAAKGLRVMATGWRVTGWLQPGRAKRGLSHETNLLPGWG